MAAINQTIYLHIFESKHYEPKNQNQILRKDHRKRERLQSQLCKNIEYTQKKKNVGQSSQDILFFLFFSKTCVTARENNKPL